MTSLVSQIQANNDVMSERSANPHQRARLDRHELTPKKENGKDLLQ